MRSQDLRAFGTAEHKVPILIDNTLGFGDVVAEEEVENDDQFGITHQGKGFLS